MTFGCDVFWAEDPLPIMNYDDWKSREPGERWEIREPEPKVEDLRCERCWLPAYGSIPGHVFCREHFEAHQRQAIAEIVARRQQGAA